MPVDYQTQKDVQEYESPSTNDKFMNVGKCASTGKDVTICYHTVGNPSDPCLLLVCGLSQQLVQMPVEFVQPFVDACYYVITYDNRDIGLSTHFDEFPAPSLLRLALPAWASIREKLPYTLYDMMQDGIGLLNGLGIEKAHVFGLSMGGMIVQLMAIHHPTRVRSLNILFSHAGGSDIIHPSILTYARFLKQPASTSVEDRVDTVMWMLRYLSQGQYRDNYDEVRESVRYSLERDTNRTGVLRQMAALSRAPSRRKALERLQVRTLVIHGGRDPLIPVANGHVLASVIPGAKFVIFAHLGHDLPPLLCGELAEDILGNMKKA